jgi:biotin operon repressor
MKAIGEIIEQNITLNNFDPVSAGGFTQVPNFILRDPKLSIGAKLTYAMFLSYAWQNDRCFPGQERLADDIGMARSSVTAFIGELESHGFIAIQRRGQGKTNLYTVTFQVNSSGSRPEVSRLTSRSQSADRQKSAR